MGMRDLDLALVLRLADKVSAPANKIHGVSGRLAQKLGQTKRELSQLNQQSKKLKALQGLNTKLASGSKYTKAMGKQMIALRKELKETGVDTNNLSKAQFTLGQKTSQLNRKLEQQRRGLGLVKRAGDKVSSMWGGMKKAAKWTAGAGLAGLLAMGAAGTSMAGTAGTTEDYLATLEIIEGSQAKAKQSMAWVSKFASSTPYQLGQVNEAFVQLRTYGLDPTNGLMRTLGDTSAAMGKPIMQAVEAMADAVMGENERLKEFGIKARADGDLFTYSFTDKKGQQKELSALKDNRKNIEKVLTQIWANKFDGSMERRSKNWNGMWSNMGDWFTRFQNMVMDSGAFAYMKTELASVLATLDSMAKSGELQAWAERIGTAMLDTIKWSVGFAKSMYDAYWSAREFTTNTIESVASVVTFINGLPDRFLDAGRNMIDGLGRGIDERLGSIKAKIMGLGDLLPEWLRTKLDIHSPSRVFATIGGHIADGVAVGVDKRTPAALDAVQRLGSRLPGAMPRFVSGGGVAASMAAATLTIMGGVNINIHPAPGQSAEDIGREVARQITMLTNQQAAKQRASYIDV